MVTALTGWMLAKVFRFCVREGGRAVVGLVVDGAGLTSPRESWQSKKSNGGIALPPIQIK